MKSTVLCLAIGVATLTLPLHAEDVLTLPTPEPGTIVMFAGGIGALLLAHKLRKKSK